MRRSIFETFKDFHKIEGFLWRSYEFGFEHPVCIRLTKLTTCLILWIDPEEPRGFRLRTTFLLAFPLLELIITFYSDTHESCATLWAVPYNLMQDTVG